MQLALDDAGAAPEQVSALIAHATATPKGDAAEIAAINTVYRPRRTPLPVSSHKGHMGHTGAASGAVSVIAAAHAMRVGSFLIPLMPGSAYVPVWEADQTPVVPDSAQAVQPRTYFPPAALACSTCSSRTTPACTHRTRSTSTSSCPARSTWNSSPSPAPAAPDGQAVPVCPGPRSCVGRGTQPTQELPGTGPRPAAAHRHQRLLPACPVR